MDFAAVPVSIRLRSGLGCSCRHRQGWRLTAATCRCSVPENWQVQVAVDPAELAAGFDHVGGAPARRHLPVLPTFDAPYSERTACLLCSR